MDPESCTKLQLAPSDARALGISHVLRATDAGHYSRTFWQMSPIALICRRRVAVGAKSLMIQLCLIYVLPRTSHAVVIPPEVARIFRRPRSVRQSPNIGGFRPPHLIDYKCQQLLDHITPAVFLLKSVPSAFHHPSILDNCEQMLLRLA